MKKQKVFIGNIVKLYKNEIKNVQYKNNKIKI